MDPMTFVENLAYGPRRIHVIALTSLFSMIPKCIPTTTDDQEFNDEQHGTEIPFAIRV